jgi:hypothetical protein
MISTKAAFARHERKRRSTPRLTDLLFHSIPIPPRLLASLETLAPFSPWREASSALLAAFCRVTRGVASKLHFPLPSSVSGEGSVLRNLRQRRAYDFGTRALIDMRPAGRDSLLYIALRD